MLLQQQQQLQTSQQHFPFSCPLYPTPLRRPSSPFASLLPICFGLKCILNFILLFCFVSLRFVFRFVVATHPLLSLCCYSIKMKMIFTDFLTLSRCLALSDSLCSSIFLCLLHTLSSGICQRGCAVLDFPSDKP